MGSDSPEIDGNSIPREKSRFELVSTILVNLSETWWVAFVLTH